MARPGAAGRGGLGMVDDVPVAGAAVAADERVIDIALAPGGGGPSAIGDEEGVDAGPLGLEHLVDVVLGLLEGLERVGVLLLDDVRDALALLAILAGDSDACARGLGDELEGVVAGFFGDGGIGGEAEVWGGDLVELLGGDAELAGKIVQRGIEHLLGGAELHELAEAGELGEGAGGGHLREGPDRGGAWLDAAGAVAGDHLEAGHGEITEGLGHARSVES